MTTVHELAHVIDRHSRIQTGVIGSYGGPVPTYGRFSDAWGEAPLTDYAACRACVNAWERWAEAVTVWVFGSEYKGQETANKISPSALALQMDRLGALLNGWY